MLLIEKPKDLSSNMFSSCLFVIHDSSTRRQNNISNTSSRQELIDPFLQFVETDVESGGDDAALVQSPIKLNDNLSGTMVINFFEFTNVTYSVLAF